MVSLQKLRVARSIFNESGFLRRFGSTPRSSNNHVSAIHAKLKRFAEPTFWDEQYDEQSARSVRNHGSATPDFDWFLSGSDLKQGLNPFWPSSGVVLDVGCGTSTVMEHLASSGCDVVFGVDGSSVAIATQAARHTQNIAQVHTHDRTNDHTHVLPLVSDLRSALPFRDNTFDVIIDKGTTDSLLLGDAVEAAQSLHEEMVRTLQHGGRVLHVSDTGPDTRIAFLEKFWKCSVTSLGDVDESMSRYFLYTLHQRNCQRKRQA
eukprot:m.118160 g.118160  ORF g.118160 m.118160 type:complete len:262 (+) comp28637_c0_seq1:174-959(+)